MNALTFSLPAPNMTTLERVIRSTLGLVGLTIAGTQWGLVGDGVVAFLGWAVVLAASLDLAITGAVGYCPLYRLFDLPWALTAPN